MTPPPYPLVSNYTRTISRAPRDPAETAPRRGNRPLRRRVETREAFVPTLTHEPLRAGVVRVSRGDSVWAKWAQVLMYGAPTP